MRAIALLLHARFGICGPLALRCVARSFGVRAGWHQIGRLAGTGRTGTTLLGLKHAAVALGFKARALRTNYAGLAILPKPLIVHMTTGHYEVLRSCDDSGVFVGGLFVRRRARQKFLGRWSGAALMLSSEQISGKESQ